MKNIFVLLGTRISIAEEGKYKYGVEKAKKNTEYLVAITTGVVYVN